MIIRAFAIMSAVLLAAVLASCTSETAETSADHRPSADVSSQISQGPGNPDAAATDGQEIAPNAVTESVTLDPSAVTWTARDIDGNLRASGDWIGKQPVVINFWGTWCPPCRREIPDLVRIYEEYQPKGVEIIGFAVRDRPEQVRRYATGSNMGWVMLLANEQVATDYRLTVGVPTTIFLDRTGKEIGRFVGPRDYDTFKQAFEAIL